MVYASTIQWSRPPATTMYGSRSSARKGAIAPTRSRTSRRNITRLSSVGMLDTRKLVPPSFHPKRSLRKKPLSAIPPVPA
nr:MULTISPECIES: hypothetical protein [Sorangium]